MKKRTLFLMTLSFIGGLIVSFLYCTKAEIEAKEREELEKKMRENDRDDYDEYDFYRENMLELYGEDILDSQLEK